MPLALMEAETVPRLELVDTDNAVAFGITTQPSLQPINASASAFR